MTLHWSPAAGAAVEGDPAPFPINPSRLRPWKAPKKESSLAAAGFLAGVVYHMRKKRGIRLHIFVFTQQILLIAALISVLLLPAGGSGGSWSEFFWPTSLRSSWPVWLAVVSLSKHQTGGNIRCDTWASSWYMPGTAWSRLSKSVWPSVAEPEHFKFLTH